MARAYPSARSGDARDRSPPPSRQRPFTGGLRRLDHPCHRPGPQTAHEQPRRPANAHAQRDHPRDHPPRGTGSRSPRARPGRRASRIRRAHETRARSTASSAGHPPRYSPRALPTPAHTARTGQARSALRKSATGRGQRPRLAAADSRHRAVEGVALFPQFVPDTLVVRANPGNRGNGAGGIRTLVLPAAFGGFRATTRNPRRVQSPTSCCGPMSVSALMETAGVEPAPPRCKRGALPKELHPREPDAHRCSASAWRGDRPDSNRFREAHNPGCSPFTPRPPWRSGDDRSRTGDLSPDKRALYG
jgi:hypothetical protein